jgi:hypothetical protein
MTPEFDIIEATPGMSRITEGQVFQSATCPIAFNFPFDWEAAELPWLGLTQLCNLGLRPVGWPPSTDDDLRFGLFINVYDKGLFGIVDTARFVLVDRLWYIEGRQNALSDLPAVAVRRDDIVVIRGTYDIGSFGSDGSYAGLVEGHRAVAYSARPRVAIIDTDEPDFVPVFDLILDTLKILP